MTQQTSLKKQKLLAEKRNREKKRRKERREKIDRIYQLVAEIAYIKLGRKVRTGEWNKVLYYWMGLAEINSLSGASNKKLEDLTALLASRLRALLDEDTTCLLPAMGDWLIKYLDIEPKNGRKQHKR